jgi:N-acetylglutamate synthase-like GNAT family acetyltransferase
MADGISVRQATSTDIDWLVAHELPHMTRDRITAKVVAREYLVASSAAGLLGLLRFSHLWSAVPFIELIFVEPDRRMEGVGKALLQAMEHWARENGDGLVMSSSQADEPEAQGWHRQVGFRDAGVINDLHPFQDVAEVLFAKNLGGRS